MKEQEFEEGVTNGELQWVNDHGRAEVSTDDSDSDINSFEADMSLHVVSSKQRCPGDTENARCSPANRSSPPIYQKRALMRSTMTVCRKKPGT